MLSIRKLQKCANEPKLHEGQTCIKPQKDGSKGSQQQVQVSSVAKFAGCEFSQPCNLLQISSGLIMHLRIQLGFIVFESD